MWAGRIDSMIMLLESPCWCNGCCLGVGGGDAQVHETVFDELCDDFGPFPVRWVFARQPICCVRLPLPITAYIQSMCVGG